MAEGCVEWQDLLAAMKVDVLLHKCNSLLGSAP